MTPAVWPRDCCLGGRKLKPRVGLMLDRVLVRQAILREQDHEITTLVVMLRAIAAQRGENLHGSAGNGEAQHLALAIRIDRRVRMLLSVDWELQRAKELIDEYLPDEQGRRADLQGVGDMPA